MNTSVGLILTDGSKFLVCHSTNNKFYDLPKGMAEKDEKYIDTCVREVWEETGLVIDSKKLLDLGKYEYMSSKDLYLYIIKYNELPSIENLFCNSKFKMYGREFPECDGYKYIAYNEIDLYMTKQMSKTLKYCLTVNNIFKET